MKTLILLVLLTVTYVAFAQNPKGNRYYIAGSFSRLNSFSRPAPVCFDNARGSWIRTQSNIRAEVAAKTGVVWTSENQAYYAENNQIWYYNGTVAVPFLGINGIFRYQETSSSQVTNAAFTRIAVNKAQDRLWVIGTFTKAGTTTFNTRGAAQTGSLERIAVLDITNKNSPAFINCPVTTTFASFDTSYMWTQGRTLIFGANFPLATTRLLRLNCDPAGFTEVSSPTQTLPSSGFFKQAYGDESLFAYSITGVLSAAPSTIPSYIRLATDSSAWVNVFSGNPTGVPSENLSPTVWTPTGAREVYFIYNNPTGGPTVDDNNQLGQYIFKVTEGTARERVVPAGRLTNSLNVANLPSLSNSVVTGLLWDDHLRALLVFGPTWFISGEYASAIPNAASGLITLDLTRYFARPLGGIAALNGTTFVPALGGGLTTSVNNLRYIPTANAICFSSNTPNVPMNVYDVYAPGLAMFDQSVGSWTTVPGMNVEGDVVNGVGASIFAIERTGDQFSPDAYFAGYFRTIGNTVYNSIVKYSLDANGAPTLTALTDAVTNNIGVSVVRANGETVTGTAPDDRNFARYYTSSPATITGLAYDKNAKMLYVAGTFNRNGLQSISSTTLMRWNENTRTWHELDGGVNGPISKMFVSGGNLYVFGSFSYAGSTHVKGGMAMFNTATQRWEGLGDGAFDTFVDAVEYAGNIYIIASFAGGQTLANVHRYNPNSKTWFSLTPRLTRGTLDGNTCFSTTSPVCSAAFNAFYILSNRLFVTDNNRNLYSANGENYELVHNSNAVNNVGRYVYRNSLNGGQKITLAYANNGGVQMFQDRLDNSYFYNPERDGLFADATINVWSSSVKATVSLLVLLVAALLFLL